MTVQQHVETGFQNNVNLKKKRMDFPSCSVVKNLHCNAGDTSLIWEDPLEKEMETHSSILAWEIQWTEQPGRLQSMESKESDKS